MEATELPLSLDTATQTGRSLPEDVVISILAQASPWDLASAAAVCMGWRSHVGAVTKSQGRSLRRMAARASSSPRATCEQRRSLAVHAKA